MLAGLDRLVGSLGAESRNEEIFVTVVYGVLEPADGTITLASAGHPPPVLRRAGLRGGPATAELVQVPPGAPLGLGGRCARRSLQLEPGDTILMFSDGVVERRDRPLSAGLGDLVAAAAAATSGDPRNLCSLATAAVSGPHRRRRGGAGGGARGGVEPLGHDAGAGRADRARAGYASG